MKELFSQLSLWMVNFNVLIHLLRLFLSQIYMCGSVSTKLRNTGIKDPDSQHWSGAGST